MSLIRFGARETSGNTRQGHPAQSGPASSSPGVSSKLRRSPLGLSPRSRVFTLKDLVSCLVLVITLLNRDIKMND